MESILIQKENKGEKEEQGNRLQFVFLHVKWWLQKIYSVFLDKWLQKIYNCPTAKTSLRMT